MQSPQFQRLDLAKLPPNFRGRSAIFVQIWWLVQASLFRFSPQFMYGWRRFLLRLFGAKIGKRVMVRPTVKVIYPWRLEIGDYSWIGDQVELYTLGSITIGKQVVISQKSYLCTGSHDFTSIDFSIFTNPIVIEDQVWIAADVFVSPGVTIGRGSVVGARSSVFGNLPAGKVCFGHPAQPVKDR
jgi:putative colanic acid biosynthesis acetyltransferase WcaF